MVRMLTMTDTQMLVVANTPAIVFAILAGVLAFRGVSGWGWFLFVAALVTVTPGRL